MTGINRRGLLKGSIFGMAAAGASVIPVAVQAQAAAPVKTEEYDVVVIGCGCAGMAGRTHQKLSNEPRYRSPFIGDLTRGTF